MPITERFTPEHTAGVIHARVHRHGGGAHVHTHAHDPDAHLGLEERPQGPVQQLLARVRLYQLLRPLAVGIVHGLAGSAALLVLTTIHSPRWTIAYLLVFGLGTISGMMLITTILGAPFAYTGKRFASLNRGLGVASGVISVAFRAQACCCTDRERDSRRHRSRRPGNRALGRIAPWRHWANYARLPRN